MLTPFSRLTRPLTHLLCALPLLASAPLLAAKPDGNWQQTLEEAKGQKVYFNAWGGSPEINAYLVWAGQELARDYQVTLVQVKVDDIAQSVSQLLANKQAGRQTERRPHRSALGQRRKLQGAQGARLAWRPFHG